MISVRDNLGLHLSGSDPDSLEHYEQGLGQFQCYAGDPLAAVEAVAEAAAVGMPDERWGERPVILVVAKPGTVVEAPAHAAVAAAIAAGRLSKWAAPERVVTVTTIPKTSVGKIDKKAIRAALAAGNIA